MSFFTGLLFFALLVAVIWLKAREPYIIGAAGERFVAEQLATLPPLEFSVLHNLLLPSNGNIKTTQIDHVVISRSGIFCIETKSYKGWIFGNANQEYWTQVIFRSRHRFYNPIRQNFAHTKALQAILGPTFVGVPVYSLVAMPNADKIRVTGTNAVGSAGETVEKILSYKTFALDDAKKQEIYSLLLNANITDKESRKNHVRDAEWYARSKSTSWGQWT